MVEFPMSIQLSTSPVQREPLDLSMPRQGNPSCPRFSTISSGPAAIEIINGESSSCDNGNRIDHGDSVQMPAHECKSSVDSRVYLRLDNDASESRHLKWKSRLIARYYREREEANRIECHQSQAERGNDYSSPTH